jgi:SAM-dependent MidA family methyltransferase
LNQVAEKILAEIRNYGVISFARFMECALYCPVYGYYEKEEDTSGCCGDYYTSVSVGRLFGELLALQFSDWLEKLQQPAHRQGLERTFPPCQDRENGAASRGRKDSVEPLPEPLQIVEAGAHNGQLAGDILTWLRVQRPGLLAAIKYCIVEPSPRRQAWQRQTLSEFAGQVQWVESLGELFTSGSGQRNVSGKRPVRGLIFSNELLDAMPIHRFGWDLSSKTWFEWGVTFSDGRFNWMRLPQKPDSSQNQGAPDASWPLEALLTGIPAWPEDIFKQLPDGFTVEVCPAAIHWWTSAAEILECGRLITVDYGLLEDELLSPERGGGTLRAYRSHHLAEDVLADPGQQDITSHVNFSALRQAGETAGLTTDDLSTQEQFLTRIAAPVLAEGSRFGEWTKARIRQFQTLTHPNHLGRAFRVLVQSRKGETANLR